VAALYTSPLPAAIGYVFAVTRLRASDFLRADGELGGPRARRPVGVDEAAVLTVLRVPPEQGGSRVDRFVQSELKRTSRTRAAFIVANSAYSLDGRRLKPGDRLRPEDHVALWRPPWDEEVPDLTIPVLYDDGDLLAVDKPAGVPVHPSARYYQGTVVKLLEHAGLGEHLRLAHRIDRETSGVLLLTRTHALDRAIKRLFEARDAIEKRYLAITWGAPPEQVFTVELPLELDPTHSTRVKMRVAAAGEGLTARTRFEVQGRRRCLVSGRHYALVSCLLDTGRQHQIRAHLSALGFPLVGDKLYGPDDTLFAKNADGLLTPRERELLELDRHALHAHTLTLVRPETGARLCIEAPLPADLRAFWASLAPG
jgi:23S rRNA pseudouridine1911/1915/1917 synthase